MGRLGCDGISLDGQWELKFCRHSEYRAAAAGKTDYAALCAAFSACAPLAARVPGDAESALLGDDPYFALTPQQTRQHECYHYLYTTRFALARPADREAFLVFEGIDTAADIFIDGRLMLKVENMFIAHELDISALDDGEHTLQVHISPAVIYARRYAEEAQASALRYNWAGLHLRKAAHMLGWDIFPRMVSAGIWRGVHIDYRPTERIIDAFLYTCGVGGGKAKLCLSYNLLTEADSLEDLSIELEGRCGDSRFYAADRLWHTSGRLEVEVDSPLLWRPINRGEQHLYHTQIRFMRGNVPLDSRELEFGIRTVRLERSSVEDGSGEFCFYVNGERIFVLGTNWVPTDALHRDDPARYRRALELLGDSGCNMVRCWGGGVYEREEFYDYCDKNGILVWQDFMMGCSYYPQDTQFCAAMEKEVGAVVKRLRNHACLALWAGDNECDCAASDWGGVKADPNDNVITRRVIPDILRREDFTRPYLPSSPYMDAAAVSSGLHPTEEHLWGPRDYFKGEFYSSSVCHFASETGYHGCPCPESIKKFISPGSAWPWHNNEQWLLHASSPEPGGPYDFRIGLMAAQVKTLFGQLPDDPERFSFASQASQAEAMKYFIERFRITKWRRTGIIWWNLLDGWPQFSDAVVDYYFERKLAYRVIKRCQQPLLLALDEPDGQGRLNLYAINDLPRELEFNCRVTDLDSGEEVIEIADIAPADASKPLGGFIPEGQRHFYLIEWEYDGKKCVNHYQADTLGLELDKYTARMRQIDREEAK